MDAQLKTTLLAPLTALTQWAADRPALQTLCRQFADLAQAGTQRLLPGPTGERNTWTLLPRERVLCLADDEQDALTQLAAVLAVGSQALWSDDASTAIWRNVSPPPLRRVSSLRKRKR